MANDNVPNDASAKSKAEGERWKSDSEAVERYDQTIGGSVGDEGGGITNRPIGEEIENQASLPDRGESREDARGRARGARRREGGAETMTRADRSRLDDPTAENAQDQTTPGASGLTAGRSSEEVAHKRAADDDLVVRKPAPPNAAPRRYEQPADEDPVMPSDDPSLNTKI